MDDFANAPKSITEIKADRAHDAALWTPRDAVIAMLRGIDSGEFAPTTLVIAYQENTPDDEHRTGYRMAGDNPMTAMGVLARVMWMLNEG